MSTTTSITTIGSIELTFSRVAGRLGAGRVASGPALLRGWVVLDGNGVGVHLHVGGVLGGGARLGGLDHRPEALLISDVVHLAEDAILVLVAVGAGDGVRRLALLVAPLLIPVAV